LSTILTNEAKLVSCFRVLEFQATAKPKEELSISERLKWAKAPGEGDTLLLLYMLGNKQLSKENMRVISVASQWVHGTSDAEPVLADMGLKLVGSSATIYPDLDWRAVGGVEGAKQYFHNVHNQWLQEKKERERQERQAIDGTKAQRDGYFKRKVAKIRRGLSRRA
jgi:hypothetical protein